MYETERKTVMREGTDNAPKGKEKQRNKKEETEQEEEKLPSGIIVTSEEIEEYEVQTSELVLEKSSGISKGRTEELKK